MSRRFLLPLLLAVLLLLPGCSLSEELAVEPPPEDYVAAEDGFRYTRSCLSPQEQYLCDQIVAGLRAQAPRIEGLYPDLEMLQRAIEAVGRDYPELFWFSGEGQIETVSLGGRAMEAAYVPTYTMDEGLRAEVQELVDAWAADCAAGLPEHASDYEKALHVYEYLAAHAAYQTVEGNSLANIVLYGHGLCGCYAKTAQYMLNLLGVPCAYISGQARDESHAWDLVWLDGEPCWMDPTWGDPVMEEDGPSISPAYEYFGLTTEELTRTHTIDDVVPVPDCTSRANSFYAQNGLSFDWYQPDAIEAAMETALRAGWEQLPLRFAADSYEEAVQVLLEKGEVYRLFRQARENTGVALHLESAIWYSTNEELYTVAIQIPY